MFRNYFKIASRNLSRNKGFTITNVLGLVIGMSCTLLILLWVNDELGYDKFHDNQKNIHQVMATRNFNNQVFTDRNMVLPMAAAIEAGSPLVKNAVVTTHRQGHVLTYGENKLKKDGYTVSEHFFNVFSWKFKKGNAATAIPDAYSLVLTESAAKSLFGDEDPINKTVRIDNDYDTRVSAIVADPPGNSTFQFDFINRFNYSGDVEKRAMTNWVNSSWDVFVQTVPGANLKLLEKQINDIKYQHDPHDKGISTYFTFPMNKWRLYSDFKDGKNIGGMIDYVKLFTIIAAIILLIACINFMNLSTARSEKRAKEVGVRKTLGSGRKELTMQFYMESMMLTVFAFVISIVVVYMLLPFFNQMVDKHMTLEFSNPLFWLGAIGIILFTGAVAGSYPALYLSSFNPVRVLKGTMTSGRGAILPRRILVITQFAISIFLISATIVVYSQLRHIKNRELGYNPDNLVMVPTSGDIDKNFAIIKQELLRTGMIEAVNRTSAPITEIWWRSPAPDWEGKPQNANVIFTGMSTDVDYVKTMGIKLIAGKDFTGTPADSSSIMMNEAAVKAMGVKNPLGMQLKRGRRNYVLTGITTNVIMETPYKPVDPLAIYYNPEFSGVTNIRLKKSVQPQKAIQSIESVFKKYNAAFPFEYKFVDDEFSRKFLTEELISKITNIFAGLAIFICCLGLAGLASFTIEKRIREIGIRKVLGASVQQVVMLISKEFLKLVAVAFIIAAPVGWILMNNWLQKYDFRVEIHAWMFGIVGLLILLLTLVVVSLNTIKAAVANPVKSLRTE